MGYGTSVPVYVAQGPVFKVGVITERYERISFDTIAYEATVEDPNVFATPVRYTGTLTLRPDWEIGEYVCTENNQDYETLFETD